MSDADAPNEGRRNVRRERTGRPLVAEPAAPRAPRAAAGGNRRVAQEVDPEPEAPSRFSRVFGRLGSGLERLRAVDLSRARSVASHLGKFAVVALMLAAAGATGRLVERYVRTSPAFAIRSLSIDGASRLSRDEVVRAAGVTLGANVFSMPPEDIRARLERHPWIADATVRRRLPGSIEIDLRERHAVAILVVDRTYLVGEDATVFKTVEPGDPTDLPVVTLDENARWLGDREALSSLLLDVVTLAHDYARVGLDSQERLEEIHVEADDGLTLYVGASAIEVRLGHAPYEPKLRRLRRLTDELRQRDARAAYVRLDHDRRPDRVVVRLRETLVPLPPIESEPVPAASSPTRRSEPRNTPPQRPRSRA